MKYPDVLIVGAGIVGLAHALAAAKRGMKVTVVEQTAHPIGASIRNFGMVWPIGQPKGELRNLALRSREIWSEVAKSANLFADECGSIQLAFHPEEVQVLHEFHTLFPESTELLAPQEATNRFPALNPKDLRLALFSNTELCINPRQALAALPTYLAKDHKIKFLFNETVTEIRGNCAKFSTGEICAGQIFVCPGANFKILYPDFFVRHGIQQCKLQMLRATPKDPSFKLRTMLAGGLTMSHYASFHDCPSIQILKDFHANQYPDHARRGIHVMASQHNTTEITIGDSHTYGLDLDPFGEEQTDNLILGYLTKMANTSEWEITSRWQGTYSKHPSQPLLKEKIDDVTTVVTSPGGAGMTLSFGYGEANIAELIL
ncbi:MAG: TIGR03364 family FAD-dependent oxidoreductase [Fimbriimonadaceae bacterium]